MGKPLAKPKSTYALKKAARLAKDIKDAVYTSARNRVVMRFMFDPEYHKILCNLVKASEKYVGEDGHHNVKSEETPSGFRFHGLTNTNKATPSLPWRVYLVKYVGECF